jgi:hypothetical protein
MNQQFNSMPRILLQIRSVGAVVDFQPAPGRLGYEPAHVPPEIVCGVWEFVHAEKLGFKKSGGWRTQPSTSPGGPSGQNIKIASNLSVWSLSMRLGPGPIWLPARMDAARAQAYRRNSTRPLEDQDFPGDAASRPERCAVVN